MKIRNHQGYTLLEVLVYVAILTIFLNLSFEAYYRYEQNTKDLRRNAIEIVEVLRAGERWRADVRQAVTPPRLSEGSNGLSFVISQKGGEVAYAFADGVVRREVNNRSVPILTNVKSSTIERDSRLQLISWRWELEMISHHKKGALRPLFTFESVAPVQK